VGGGAVRRGRLLRLRLRRRVLRGG